MKRKMSLFKKTLLLYIAVLLFINLIQAQDKLAVLTKDDQKKFVEKVSSLLNENYVFPEVAAQIEKHIKAKSADGVFDKITDQKEFADVMTKELQSISHDKHMRVRLRPKPIVKTEKDDPVLDGIFRQKKEAESNYGFVKVEVLKGNIGYVDFRMFAPLATGREAATSAMKFLSNTYAIIFDLRKNGGGNPDLIQYICSYFFDKPTHLNSLYWRRGNRTVEHWTHNNIDGKKMPDIPLYVLTSNYTFSGAEEFSYNMQTRKRATLIGEVTGGGANPGDTFPVDKYFIIFIPTGRAINPVTGTNWEGVGVKPEIEVPADKALEVAIEKATLDAEKYREMNNKNITTKYNESKDMIEKAKILFEENKIDEGEKLINTGLENGIKNDLINESFINDMGYEFLNQKKNLMAIAIFKFNALAYPKSSNVYDSLGEAYMNNGDKQLAILNYKKSLELNLDNNNAKETLKKLNKGK
jgi:C-terminal processing protease CtpA/Prc